MTSFPNSPKLVKGGIVLVNPDTSLVHSFIPLQCNPETLTRSFQIQDSAVGDGGDKSQALRIKGPAVETLSLEAEIDATDLLEAGDADTESLGIHRELAALELLLYPASGSLRENNELARSGTLEILPTESLLTVFVWSKQRVLPVRISELSITEEAFDPLLNPLRARVSLTMRVLSVDDLGFDHKGGSLFMAYLENKERLRDRATKAQFNTLGIGKSL